MHKHIDRRTVALAFAGLLTAVSSVACVPQQHALTVQQGPSVQSDFDAAFVRGLASGWVANSYGDNEVVFAEETRDVHEGRAAQRITCASFRDGGAQMYLPGISIERGTSYSLRVWLKGNVAGAVFVGVRQHGAPYRAYLSKQLRVIPQWREYIISGVATGDDRSAGIYIMFAGRGSLLVDSLSLVHGTLHYEGLPPRSREHNLVFNAGFEVGHHGWRTPGGVTLSSRAQQGHYSVTVAPPGIESRPFAIQSGQKYTVSVQVRSSTPATRIELELLEWADEGTDEPQERDAGNVVFTATRRWTEHRLVHVANPRLWSHYLIRLRSSAPFDLDDVRVSEGQTALRDSGHNEISADTTTRWTRAGESVTIVARVPLGQHGHAIRFTLLDLWSRTVASADRTTQSNGSVTARFSTTSPGIYRVRVELLDTGVSDETWFGVLAADPPQSGRIGLHHRLDDEQIGTSQAIGVRWLRLHDFETDYCHWYRVEPTPGNFVWFDSEIDRIRAAGFEIVANLSHPPGWAVSGAAEGRRWSPSVPVDITRWQRYVEETVKHYRGRIRYWEVWNEPYNPGFFDGTPAQYATLLAVAYRTIKKVDPSATVIGGVLSLEYPQWTKDFIRAGGLQNLDVVSFHAYWRPSDTANGPRHAPPRLVQQLEQLRSALSAGNKSYPLWMTEGGVRAPPMAGWIPEREGVHATPLEAATALVEGHVEMLSAGVAVAIYYHAAPPLPWFSTIANGAYSLLDYERRPKATFLALAGLVRMLPDTAHVLVHRRNGRTAHIFHGSTTDVAVLWSDRKTQLRLPEHLEAFDLMSAPVRARTIEVKEPVYVRAGGEYRELLVSAINAWVSHD